MGGIFKSALFALGLLAVLSAGLSHAFAGGPKTLLVFGDSLVAGYGLRKTEALPEQLGERLKQEGLPVNVLNAGVSGDTSTSGLNRIEYALRNNPDYVIVVLGGNDMLRGIDPVITRENLRRIMEKLKERNIPVLLAGMRAYGMDSNQTDITYMKMYQNLAKQYNAVLYPFILKDVALNPQLNQKDGVHPTAEGIKIIVNNILPSVAELLVKDASAYKTDPEDEPAQ